MKSILVIVLGGLVMSVGMRTSAQPLTWETSRAAAIAKARQESKLILLLAGRHTCGNCNYMLNTVLETTNPRIKQGILASAVPWFCDVDNSTEWYPYANNLGSFTLPLICFIDPERPNSYLDRSTAVQTAAAFYTRLERQPLAGLKAPLISKFVVSNGKAQLSITNLVAWGTNVVERAYGLSPGSKWTAAGTFVSTSRTTNWSEIIPAGTERLLYRVRARK